MKKNEVIIAIICILLLTLMSCSTSSSSAQRSIDTRECSDMSYGNDNIDIKAVDALYINCMDIKKKKRANNRDKEKNLAIIDFFISLFISAEN